MLQISANSIIEGAGLGNVVGVLSAPTLAPDATFELLIDPSGNNNVKCGLGNDRITTGVGRDTIDGGLGDDIVDGGSGDDIISEAGGSNHLKGGAGNDLISGGADNDVLAGAAGEYDKRVTATGWELIHSRGSKGDGTDMVSGDIEHIAFGNRADPLTAQRFTFADINTIPTAPGNNTINLADAAGRRLRFRDLRFIERQSRHNPRRRGRNDQPRC